MGLDDIRQVISLDLLFNTSCVYFLKFNGDVVYIGRTKNLFQRLYSHINTPRKGLTFNGASLILCSDEEASIIERYMIYKFKPIHNYIPAKLAPYRKKILEIERIVSQVIPLEDQLHLPLPELINVIDIDKLFE